MAKALEFSVDAAARLFTNETHIEPILIFYLKTRDIRDEINLNVIFTAVSVLIKAGLELTVERTEETELISFTSVTGPNEITALTKLAFTAT